MSTIILAIVIFLVFGISFSLIVMAQESKKKKRMMSVLQGGSVKKDKAVKANLQEQRRGDLSKKLKDENHDTNKKGVTLTEKIQQAGMSISPKQFWIFSVISGIAFTIGAKLMGFSLFVIIMMGITGLLGLPKLVLRMKAKSRQKKFMNDFADALESMMRLLKAGMPVSEAIKMVAREFTGPMGEEMEQIFEQQKIGVPLPEAVLAASKRMPLTEMQMFATAIAIQTQTGSSLSEVLQNLADVIRARFRLKRKIQALSSEAKASAGIIGALPILVATGLYFVNPEYITLLFTDPTGKFLLGCAVAWMGVGVLVMRQMINFKV